MQRAPEDDVFGDLSWGAMTGQRPLPQCASVSGATARLSASW